MDGKKNAETNSVIGVRKKSDLGVNMRSISVIPLKRTTLTIPAIKAMGFLTGLGVDKLQDEILTKAREIQAQ